MRAATSLVLVCHALAAGVASAQNITILDQNNQPHEVAPDQFVQVGPHPGIIDTDHLHAQNGICVFDVNNVFVNDPAPDPNGRGYTDVIVQPTPADTAASPLTVSNGLVGDAIVPGSLIGRRQLTGYGLDDADAAVQGDFTIGSLVNEPVDRNSIHESSGGR